MVPDPEPDTATCATFSSSCTLGDVNPSKTCAAATCTPDDCCDVSCSQGNPCSGAGLSPNAANAGQVCGTPTNTNGCSDGLCCVADAPAPTVPTCSTFPCHGLRWVPDPSKANVVCGPSGFWAFDFLLGFFCGEASLSCVARGSSTAQVATWRLVAGSAASAGAVIGVRREAAPATTTRMSQRTNRKMLSPCTSGPTPTTPTAAKGSGSGIVEDLGAFEDESIT